MEKHKKGIEDIEIDLGVIITPMLDMSFQLLAFFIMIYQPPTYEVGINTKLLPPEKVLTKGGKPKPDDPAKSGELPELKDAILVVVRAYYPEKEAGKNPDARKAAGKVSEGMPLAISIKTPEATEAREVANESDTVQAGWEKMLAALKEIRKTLGPPPSKDQKDEGVKTTIKLMCEGGLKNRYVLKAWDICKASGFDSIGFVPPPDLPGAAPSFKKPPE